MIDFSSIIQWIASNKNTISNVATVAQGVHDEYKDSQERKKHVPSWVKNHHNKKISFIRNKCVELEPKVLRIVLNCSSKPNVDRKSYALTASIDFNTLKRSLSDLEKISDPQGVGSLRALAVVCSVSKFAFLIAEHIANEVFNRDMNKSYEAEEKKYLTEVLKPLLIELFRKNSRKPFNINKELKDLNPNYTALSLGLKELGMHRTAEVIEDDGKCSRSVATLIDLYCSYFEIENFTKTYISL